jgi:hypothetical protein
MLKKNFFLRNWNWLNKLACPLFRPIFAGKVATYSSILGWSVAVFKHLIFSRHTNEPNKLE